MLLTTLYHLPQHDLQGWDVHKLTCLVCSRSTWSCRAIIDSPHYQLLRKTLGEIV